MSDNLKELTISSIFQSDIISNYVIPRYQRNYAWKQPQVVQLIQDIYDFSSSANLNNQNYYIGTLVVYERIKDGVITYETIDGQQRLTTLNILFSVLKNEFNEVSNNFRINLSFDSRPLSSYTLKHIFEKPNDDINTSEKKLNTRILSAYKTITKELRKIKQENQLEAFIEYLKNNVVLLRAPVPHDTNLNHYFEIMNNRGEQLEKHEVLKAQMLKVFEEEPKSTKVFADIWEACANMEKYVQYGFSTVVRSKLFGKHWNHFSSNNFNDIVNCFDDVNFSKDNGETISLILRNHKVIDGDNNVKEDAPEQFSSIINFSNFLLHILRILLNKSDKYTTTDELKNVPLDDKRLLDTFSPFIGNKEFAEDFAFLLLKGKHFYDKYIIKRNLKKEEWSLKYLEVEYYNKKASNKYLNSLDKENTNRRILMLLSMFHFSAPTLVYKHWLNAALNYVLDDDFDKNGVNYVCYLEQLSDAYLNDRYLANEESSFYGIIYKNDSKSKNKDLNTNKLHKGTQVENFIFNRLDYLIWKKDKGEDKMKYSNFYFSLRTSVEHYYPQNPNHKDDKLKRVNILNSFGNLCLISARKNSQLSNALPEIKKGYYKDNDRIIESLKQRKMMSISENWREKQILEHGKEMIQILIQPSNTAKVISLKSRKIKLQWNFWQSLKIKLENHLILIPDKSVTEENVRNYYDEENNEKILNGLWSKIEIENPKILNNKITIHFGIEIDHKVYFGFTLEENGTVGISNNQKFNKYIEMVKSINENYKNHEYWLGWRYTQEDLNFKNPSPEIISNLADPEKLDQTTDKIVADILTDINQLKTKLENI